MANNDQKLSLMTPRGTPDLANDYIYVINGSNFYKSSLYNELGISSNPVGLTDNQTITNKALTAPTISSPVLSGTITGTYTLAGTPTFPSSVVTLTGSQTLTNKIFTSPTINSPTITNASITSDSYSGFTSANSTTIAGINITSSVFTSNNIVPNNSLINTGSFGSSWAWTSWTPTFSSAVTVGNGTHASYYQQIGKTVYARMYLTFGTTSTMGTGSCAFTLPVTARSAVYTTKQHLGTGLAITGASEYPSIVEYSTTTLAIMWAQTISASTPVLAAYTSTTPFTWTNGSILSASIVYEAA